MLYYVRAHDQIRTSAKHLRLQSLCLRLQQLNLEAALQNVPTSWTATETLYIGKRSSERAAEFAMERSAIAACEQQQRSKGRMQVGKRCRRKRRRRS